MNILLGIVWEIYLLFLEMAPYLLLGLAFVALLNFFVTKDLIIKQVGKKDFWSVFKAALVGVPLPLCSCGVVPTAAYMKKSGGSNGATVSFLISTPQTGIDSILATYGMMGWVFAIYRPLVALIMGIVGGLSVHYFDKQLPKVDSKKDLPKFININHFQKKKKEPLFEKIKKTLNYSFVEFVDDIAPQFIVGLVIAALISFFLPTDFIASIGLNGGILAMLLMVAIGIPMYVCATASIPIAVTLMSKGFSPGTAFVFLVTGPATNAASISIISKTIGKKLTVVYIGSIVIMSLIFGLLLDWIFLTFGMHLSEHLFHNHNHSGDTFSLWIKYITSGLFLILLLGSIYRIYLKKYFVKKNTIKDDRIKLNISGMTCNHCVATVSKTIEKIKGVEEFEVSLNENAAFIKGNFDKELLKKEIESVGYKVE